VGEGVGRPPVCLPGNREEMDADAGAAVHHPPTESEQQEERAAPPVGEARYATSRRTKSPARRDALRGSSLLGLLREAYGLGAAVAFVAV
jgi:hypothetical protein